VKDGKFESVVHHFLNTKPQPHKQKGKEKERGNRKPEA